MTPLQALDPQDIAVIAGLIGDHPAFRIYLADGLAAARAGAVNRLARIGRDRRGVALCIVFDGLQARTLIGEVAPDEELALADMPGRAELHLPTPVADRVAPALGHRLELRQDIRFYRFDGPQPCAPDARCRRLGPAELPEVSAFFAAHYPETVFSSWMLERPFLGLYEDGRLMACGGVHAMAGQIANLGNFLTAPEARRRGLARAVAASLMHELAGQGVTVFTLGVTESNLAAARLYETIGFRPFDARVQLVVAAAG